MFWVVAEPVPATSRAFLTLVRSVVRVQIPPASEPCWTPVLPVNVRVRVLVPEPLTEIAPPAALGVHLSRRPTPSRNRQPPRRAARLRKPSPIAPESTNSDLPLASRLTRPEPPPSPPSARRHTLRLARRPKAQQRARWCQRQ